jgi:hypothetical protein
MWGLAVNRRKENNMDLPKKLRLIAKGFATERVTTGQARSAVETLNNAAAEIERLQRILDGRPSINAGLPETYIEWSQGIYQTDIARAIGTN